ncbi:Pectinesterase [Melia azedarach]|uniref:Pectinesterase n=1 Tax=Melia azedarach TaxID=155640 RepID=A0ACC1YXG8_MELAZ|nr:Pectinesterase [Melia azedarach]
MIRQVVVSVISLILVVGVVIGIICSVSNDVRKREQQEISQQQRKAVTRFCVPAEFKDTCINTLNDASTYDPQLLLKATIYSAETAMRNLFNLSEALLMEATNNKDNSSKMNLEDCKETLQFAIDDLNTTWSTVADNELHNLHTRTDDMMAWLNAAVTYQHTCLDGFEVETNPFSEQMRKAAIEPTQLTANALSIVKDLTTILGSLGVTIQPMNDRQPIKNRRRLLQAANDGYPSWFSAADRKLLVKNEWTPTAVVAQDGSGDYKTIQEALDAYPKDLRGRYVIHIKAGIYDEQITIGRHQKYVFMYGDGMIETVVTNNKSAKFDGLNTMRTATLSALGEGFVAKHMAFSNSAGAEGQQAVALRVQADKAAFLDCVIDGFQHTLYTHTYRQFYRECYISGTIDFIFGDCHCHYSEFLDHREEGDCQSSQHSDGSSQGPS